MNGRIPHFRSHVVTFVVGIGATAAFVLWLLSLGHGLPSAGAAYQVRAVLPTSSALATGARVTVAGLRVGDVRSIERRGTAAIVTLRIDDKGVTPLPADSTFQLRQRTPVGENYVSVTPGRSEEDLASGAVVQAIQVGEYVDVDQILSVLKGHTKTRARTLIRGLGDQLGGEGPELNALLGGTAATLDHGGRLVSLLGGQRHSIAQLIDQLGLLTRSIGDRQAAVRRLATSGTNTLRALADRDAAVRSILDELPPTLTRAKKTVQTLSDVTGRATPVVLDLATALGQLRPALAALPTAARTGDTALRELGAAAPRLEQTLAAVRSATPSTAAALPQLRRALCQVEPMAKYLEPYRNDVASALQGMGSSANAYDATGHQLRLMVTLHPDFTFVGLPANVKAGLQTLLHAGLLTKLTGVTWDPFPKPNMIGKTGATGKPSAVGPADFATKSGYTYPRITPSC